ncbi:MAG: hypothetical protein ACSHXI_13555 [Hoeflea sp.]|uniref:hypothetical protein n=1 Tax=Hoeflea sp. TaxID=1940281 RepID=UPI003EF5AFEB
MRWALVDFGHAFYRPLTRRIIIFALLLVWTGVEFFSGSTGWIVFFLALSAYVGWGFFLSGQADGAVGETVGKDQAPPRNADK